MTKTDSQAVLEPAPSSGWLDGQIHVFPVRVYYEDTDFSGLVYHASYLRFMERGRSEFLRLAGAGHKAFLTAAEPLAWAVRRMTIGFIKPARMDDPLTVRTGVLELAGARMRLDQTIARSDETLVKADVEVCVITFDGRPRRVPDALRRKLESFRQA